jgi:hypothetical protein
MRLHGLRLAGNVMGLSCTHARLPHHHPLLLVGLTSCLCARGLHGIFKTSNLIFHLLPATDMESCMDLFNL